MGLQVLNGTSHHPQRFWLKERQGGGGIHQPIGNGTRIGNVPDGGRSLLNDGRIIERNFSG
jgi:hypothetical protein